MQGTCLSLGVSIVDPETRRFRTNQIQGFQLLDEVRDARRCEPARLLAAGVTEKCGAPRADDNVGFVLVLHEHPFVTAER